METLGVQLVKRRAATQVQATEALRAYADIPIRFVDVDLTESVELAVEFGLYAYDAYLLACAKNQNAPLLTLDKALMKDDILAAIREGRRPVAPDIR